MCPLGPLLVFAALGSPPAATFSSLTLVGERWDNGQWSALDKAGHMVGPPLKRGDKGAVAIESARESPDLLRLSETTILCSANDTVMSSSDGGRSWSKHGGNPGLAAGYIPAPMWLKSKESMPVLLMDVQPVDAYVKGCYPMTPNCTEVTTVTAATDKQYVDWGLSASGAPVAVTTAGRKGANVWRGLPVATGLFATSAGGGVQLLDGSYVYLAVVQFGPLWQVHPKVDKSKLAKCCNNSVASFASKDGLDWVYQSTVDLYDEARIYQEGPSECDIVLLKDGKTLWSVMRVDGGDGEPSHRTLPMLSATSTDGGKSES